MPAPVGSRWACIRRSSRSAMSVSIRAGAGTRRAQTARDWTDRPLVMIAGPCRTNRASGREARVALAHGYHAGLLSLAPMKGASIDELIEHCAAVAQVIPLVGFYLQPSVGGIVLPAAFWQRFAAIDNVVAIKMAPFDRYRTLDVIRGVVAAGAEDRVTLYTGNDDHIVLDLLVPFEVAARRQARHRCGSRAGCSATGASGCSARCNCSSDRAADAAGNPAVSAEMLALDSQVTDCNAAILRRRERLRRLHRRMSRDPAPARPARRHLVPRSGRGLCRRARRQRSTGSAAIIRTWTTTPSCATTSRGGWHDVSLAFAAGRARSAALSRIVAVSCEAGAVSGMNVKQR